MVADPQELVVVARRYRAELRRLEELRRERLTSAWLAVTRVLEAQAEVLARRISAGGDVITPSLVLQHERYRALVAQARAELARYADDAGALIARDAQAALELAGAAVREALTVTGVFDRLPTQAVRAAVAWTADDTSALARLIAANWPDAIDAMTRALIVAVGAGRDPATVARDMIMALDIGLDRALTISRTEVLRAHRRGQLDGYRASGVVIGYRRLATHDGRVCLGCLFTEGMTFDAMHDFDAHPNCRCTMVPIVVGVDPPRWSAGTDWFLAQPPARQREILGATRYAMWRDGRVANLRDFATHVHDPDWGGAFVPTPIRDLRAA